MAAPTIVNSVNTALGSTTSPAINVGTPSNGNLLVKVAMCGIGPTTWTKDSAWTGSDLGGGDYQYGDTAIGSSMGLYKTASSEPTSYTHTLAFSRGVGAICFEISGWDGTTAPVWSAVNDQGAGLTPQANALSGLTSGDWLFIALAFTDGSAGAPGTGDYPTGYTDADAGDIGSYIMHAVNSTASADGMTSAAAKRATGVTGDTPGAWGSYSPSVGSHSFLVGIKGAAAGGGAQIVMNNHAMIGG